jgi:aspartyl-tRNA(Asn)/glutamyl-tRNA(Gln) amidotransferase subunit A
MPTFAGSPKRLPPRFEEAGPVVAAALKQLAIIVGKTHTVEFAFGGLGLNPHHPTPVNPWDLESHRVPGGSSAGAGVSLNEGSALLALGSDTAGSVRIPAAWTGNVALKTTRGRWSTEGLVPLSPSLDTPGLLARTVEDLSIAFTALDPEGAHPAEGPGLRFGRCDALFFEGCSPGVVEALEEALGELVAGGAEVTSIDLPEALEAWALFKRGGPVAVELHHFLHSELPDWLETLDPNVGARISDAAHLTALEYLERLATLRRLAAAAADRLRDLDALVTPTVANTPPRLEEIATPSAYARQNVLALRNTAVVSYLGLSAVTLPAGLDDAGMPVGLQLVGGPYGEPHLLAVAARCEQLLGTARDRLGVPPGINLLCGE